MEISHIYKKLKIDFAEGKKGNIVSISDHELFLSAFIITFLYTFEVFPDFHGEINIRS